MRTASKSRNMSIPELVNWYNNLKVENVELKQEADPIINEMKQVEDELNRLWIINKQLEKERNALLNELTRRGM